MNFFSFNNYKIIFSSFPTKNEKILIKNFIHKKIEKYTISELLSLLNVNNSELYIILDKFQTKSIKIDINNEIHSFNLFYGYESTSNIVILNFGHILKKNTQINNFLDLRTLTALQEKYTLRFYLKFCQNIKDSQKIDIDIESLKEVLDINSYPRFYDFERFILKNISSDIEENSPYLVFYDKVKSGENINNKIISLRFIITNKDFYANSKFAIEMLEKNSQYNNFNTAITKITELLTKYSKATITKGIKNLAKGQTIEDNLDDIIKNHLLENAVLISHIKKNADNIMILQKILFNEMEKIKETEIFEDKIVNSHFNKKFYMINIEKKLFFDTKNLRIEILELFDKDYDIKIYRKEAVIK